MISPTRPILRYHGGKWKLAKWIISHFPSHRVYVEPYGGAGSVLLQKPRSYAEIINDLDEDIVNVFRVLRDPNLAAKLVSQLRLTPYARREFEEAYEHTDDLVERARRTIARSFMGHGANAVARQKTGFRSNAHRLENGKTNAPAARDWANYPDHLGTFVERLRGVVVECRDALEVIRQHDTPHTLFYVDPPYVRSSRSDARHGYRHEMSDNDHRQLAEVLCGVRGMVVVSGYRCPLYDELFADWRRVDREAPTSGARRQIESLWLSPNIHQQQPSLFLDQAVGTQARLPRNTP